MVPAEIVGVDGFGEWLSDLSAERYPSVPKRHDNAELLEDSGFDVLWMSELREPVPMTAHELANYLMTHSERISAITSGLETDSEQFARLRAGLEPFFDGGSTQEVMYGIVVQAYRASE